MWLILKLFEKWGRHYNHTFRSIGSNNRQFKVLYSRKICLKYRGNVRLTHWYYWSGHFGVCVSEREREFILIIQILLYSHCKTYNIQIKLDILAMCEHHKTAWYTQAQFCLIPTSSEATSELSVTKRNCLDRLTESLVTVSIKTFNTFTLRNLVMLKSDSTPGKKPASWHGRLDSLSRRCNVLILEPVNILGYMAREN